MFHYYLRYCGCYTFFCVEDEEGLAEEEEDVFESLKSVTLLLIFLLDWSSLLKSAVSPIECFFGLSPPPSPSLSMLQPDTLLFNIEILLSTADKVRVFSRYTTSLFRIFNSSKSNFFLVETEMDLEASTISFSHRLFSLINSLPNCIASLSFECALRSGFAV